MSQTCPAALSDNIDNLQVVHPFYTPVYFRKYQLLDAALSENIKNFEVVHSLVNQQNKILLYP